MPTYDINCPKCGPSERMSTIARRLEPCDKCGSEVVQEYQPNNRTYAQDDIPGGLLVENLGRDPVMVYSHTERLAIAKERGLEPFIRHQTEPGSSRSKWTTNWDTGPSQDPRPISMLSPAERVERRQQAAERLGVTVAELEAVSGPIDMDWKMEDFEEDRAGGEFAERAVQNRFNNIPSSSEVREFMEQFRGK